MLKGLAGVIIAAVLFAAAIFLIFNFLGLLVIIVGLIAAGFIIGAVIAFILLFVFGFVLFFALFYFLFEKKPKIQTSGNYTLNMERGKGEEK